MAEQNDNGYVKQSRFKLTSSLTKAVIVLLFFSVILDLSGPLFNAFLFGESIKFVFGELTILLSGFVLARWATAWETYFTSKKQEDQDILVKSILESKVRQ